jgi:rod shape determining protein RodA
MVSGLLPVVGVPLPFISFGGTSLISAMIGFGLILNIENNESYS